MAREESKMENRISAARARAELAVDRERVRDALEAAGKEPDDDAVEEAAAFAEERLARLAAKAAQASDEKNEPRISAATVKAIAQRES